MKTATTTLSLPPPTRAGRIAGFVFLATLILGLALPIALLIWQAATPLVAVRSGDVGSFISATGQSGGFVQPSLTNVQTTRGSLIVYGLFSAPRGQALEVVELNKESRTHLCVVDDLATCLPLATTWTGTTMSAPRTNRAFDFARYGLGNSNLGTWLALGVLAGMVTFIAWVLMSADNTDADRDDGEPQVPAGPAA